ncbi:rod shape-determining protein MreD [Acinetobacter bohemicus]|uniref:Rod shape-determining protein MreD n=1 Tax=Acinetobacter lwoffii TaxID=28090 RepID=A0A9D2UUN3_ACILW|nr:MULTISPECIES: rod shape-determining protein MreD [Acinetobacter]MDM1780660.1 rod shape-determining protein MreD [Acinetobacter indicus]HJF29063.1 rod shape-determining protein MreD [Acinetobacter lwoffii]MCO8041928.1 rod shape-determining protein MreD [Acinetobacter sp. S4400-12]MCO8044499.1 rod shape-determining protein MreD [Acinetobacter sp. S4397-1]MCU7224591.1 rod shape-determining protein MreD [Acinetobacter bohemicus]
MSIAKMKSRTQRDPFLAIVISVILASILMVYPLSYTLSGWRPLFMLMVMLFWVLCQPTWCGIWFAFATGIFADLLLDAPLGLNALSFILIAFLARFLTRERRILTFSNLWIITAIAIVAHLMLIFFAQILASVQFSFARHWIPVLTSILVWPVLYYMLKKWRI